MCTHTHTHTATHSHTLFCSSVYLFACFYSDILSSLSVVCVCVRTLFAFPRASHTRVYTHTRPYVCVHVCLHTSLLSAALRGELQPQLLVLELLQALHDRLLVHPGLSSARHQPHTHHLLLHPPYQLRPAHGACGGPGAPCASLSRLTVPPSTGWCVCVGESVLMKGCVCV